MRHLLLISHFFPPMGGGGVQRVAKFVRYLVEHGWRTTIVCGRPEDYWMRDVTLLDEIPESARVLATAAASGLGILRRVRGSRGGDRRSSRGFGLLRRAASWLLVPDSYIGWRPFALRAARDVVHQDPPDALMSSGPPETNHLVASTLRRESGTPWLADFRDPWFGLHLLPAPTAWHRARHAKLERRVLDEADCLVATTTWLRDLLRERSHGKRAIYVIRNGYDPADFAGDIDRGDVAGGDASPLRLVHAGMLTLTRTATGLLQGLQRLYATTTPGLPAWVCRTAFACAATCRTARRSPRCGAPTCWCS
jgi:glycosyltransferase involved in cell wall biosynthesis